MITHATWRNTKKLETWAIKNSIFGLLICIYAMFFSLSTVFAFLVQIEGKTSSSLLKQPDIESQNWVQNGGTVTMVFPRWS